MKYVLIFIVSFYFVSCSEQEIEHTYPDGVEKPLSITESSGCGNIFVYQFIDSFRVITVSINAKQLNLTKKCQTFNLSDLNPNILVQLSTAGNSPDSVYFNFCNDILYPNQGFTRKLNAISGQLLVSVSKDNPVNGSSNNPYYVTIRIKDLHFADIENNKEISLDDIVFWNLLVGYLAG